MRVQIDTYVIKLQQYEEKMLKLNVLDLFSGVGGFSLGLERTQGFQTVGMCEIGWIQKKILRKHWPQVPIYNDIIKLNYDILMKDGLNKIDLICGGFPCQPFSTAAHGLNNAIDLWPYMARLIAEIRPTYIIAENVLEGVIIDVSKQLQWQGYTTYYRCISGNDIGADHQRNRWWIIAYPNSKSELPSSINAEVAKLPQLCKGLWSATNYAAAIRIPTRISDRMDERKRVEALGNAIFPQIPEAIGMAILQQYQLQM